MARDLVLLHGWAMTRRVWGPVIPALEGAFRVHNLALPGYAGADPHAGRYRGASGREILDLWSGQCLERVRDGAVWIGWSLGALVAMNAMLRAPGRIGAAVLVAPTPRFLRGGDWREGAEPGVLRDFLEGMRMNDDKALKRFVLLQAGNRRLSRALFDCAARADVDRATLEAGLRVLEEVDLRARLSEIRAPVRVVHGIRDRIVPPAVGAYVADHVPEADLVELNAGHAPFVERPEEFSEVILGWH